jgi:hypothetical protein
VSQKIYAEKFKLTTTTTTTTTIIINFSREVQGKQDL